MVNWLAIVLVKMGFFRWVMDYWHWLEFLASGGMIENRIETLCFLSIRI